MEYDVVVIGGGVVGSSTAYHLVKNGVKSVLLLEQFFSLHSRGSSHGGSRITRKGDTYTQPEMQYMTDESRTMFADLERESGKQLCISVDIVSFGPRSCPLLQSLIHYIRRKTREANFVVSAEEMNSKFLSQLKLPQDFQCVWQPETALLKPTEIVTQFQKLFVEHGGLFLDNHCVLDVIPGDIVTIRTNKGDFIARKVIITVGSWAPKLLKRLGVHLPLEVQRSEVFYWKVDNPEKFSYESFPFLIFEDGIDHFYIFPVYEYPGLIKVYCRTTRSIDPDHRDLEDPGPDSVEKVTRFIRRYLNGVSTSSPAIFEQCIYTMSPDGLPVIDKHPQHSNILFAAGMSGMGFKLSPAIGKVLTELTLDKKLSFDLSPFKLDRFSKDCGCKSKL